MMHFLFAYRKHTLLLPAINDTVLTVLYVSAVCRRAPLMTELGAAVQHSCSDYSHNSTKTLLWRHTM